MKRLLAAGVVTVAMLAGCGGGSTPISEQSCRQLAKTSADIGQRMGPDESFDTQAQAGKDAVELNQRVDALGGCPGEPSLQ